jgi:hypothetical protein
VCVYRYACSSCFQSSTEANWPLLDLFRRIANKFAGRQFSSLAEGKMDVR